jgi:hypothetical protein
MSNKVWVTWKDPTDGQQLFDKVDSLEINAYIADLRKAFVVQHEPDMRRPARLSVFETQGSEKLKASKKLKDYFVAPESSTARPGPGKEEDTALVIKFPSQQQPNGKKLYCCFCILVFPLLLRI